MKKPTGGINVLGFTACALPSCDCGARVTLGASREDLRAIVGLLKRAGFAFRGLSAAQAERAKSEPFKASAEQDLEEYLAS